MNLPAEARDLIRSLTRRGIAKCIAGIDGRVYGHNGRANVSPEAIVRHGTPIDLAEVRILRRNRLLGIDLRSV